MCASLRVCMRSCLYVCVCTYIYSVHVYICVCMCACMHVHETLMHTWLLLMPCICEKQRRRRSSVLSVTDNTTCSYRQYNMQRQGTLKEMRYSVLLLPRVSLIIITQLSLSSYAWIITGVPYEVHFITFHTEVPYTTFYTGVPFMTFHTEVHYITFHTEVPFITCHTEVPFITFHTSPVTYTPNHLHQLLIQQS